MQHASRNLERGRCGEVGKGESGRAREFKALVILIGDSAVTDTELLPIANDEIGDLAPPRPQHAHARQQ